MTLDDLRARPIAETDSISHVLDDLARTRKAAAPPPRLLEKPSPGIAFVTFAYGIDGVSLEVAKYGECLLQLVAEHGGRARIHVLGGNFAENVDNVLDGSWPRFRLPGADGWAKWDGGKWFEQLFYQDLPEDSPRTHHVAVEIWHQALELTESLTGYMTQHDIDLLYVVNVNSNPGNLALALALVLTSEVTGCPVLNNNHDFYWEGGNPGCKRSPGDPPGPRDHFFRNHDNREFFNFFQRIIPWNGRRWMQVNINPLQTRRLIDAFHFRPEHVHTIGTGLDTAFFRSCTPDERRGHRVRMAHILSDGTPTITPEPVNSFQERLSDWMLAQRPVMLAAESVPPVDISHPDAVYLLQPTRVVARKRIPRDWQLIQALLNRGPVREAFDRNPKMTLTLHITGPVPIEHREDMADVLDAYREAVDSLPPELGRRLFLALSVGQQNHPQLGSDRGLDVPAIYHLSDAVLFPSLTEGRGLPILESAAAGLPIVCSRYQPEKVYADVVGEHLPVEERILVDEFPEGEFTSEFLDGVASRLLDPNSIAKRVAHNRAVVRARYSFEGIKRSFHDIVEAFDHT